MHRLHIGLPNHNSIASEGGYCLIINESVIFFTPKMYLGIDTPQPKGVGILASSVLSRIIANPLFGYVHKRTRTARPHLK